MASVRRRRAMTSVTAALLAAGCGSGSLHPASARHESTSRGAQPAGAVSVIQSWSNALRRGDVRAAARYFQLPSVFVNGPGAVISIHNLAQAEAANEGLPCGARFVSAAREGRYTNVLFELTGRPGPGGSACASGTGQTARTNFLIRNGRIAAWIRAPDQPGDNGSPGASTSPGATPLV